MPVHDYRIRKRLGEAAANQTQAQAWDSEDRHQADGQDATKAGGARADQYSFAYLEHRVDHVRVAADEDSLYHHQHQQEIGQRPRIVVGAYPKLKEGSVPEQDDGAEDSRG